MDNTNVSTDTPKPWVSFCMSTYRRPVLLRQQLEIILQQSFTNFHIVICDNDPDASARKVAEDTRDPRVRYFANETNLGMVKSFSRSLSLATSPYVVMITDDDPVEPGMLMDFFGIVGEHPGFPIYCGCKRTGKEEGAIEVLGEDRFTFELLHPALTTTILWSSCLLERTAALEIGGMPDYGSPHLADHAMLALCSRQGGGVMINRMYSRLSSHDSNFSKSNFKTYYTGCRGFYETIAGAFPPSVYKKGGVDTLLLHLENWVLSNAFRLKKYFTFQYRDPAARDEADACIQQIMDLPFMQPVRVKYRRRLAAFKIKSIVYYLKYRLFR